MSGERISSSQRIQVASVAETEILRYKDDHAMWHKHVHSVDLDPMQILKQIEMDEHPNTVDYSCRRGRKTSAKEMHALKTLACNSHQELGIFSPRQQQSQANLKYHLEAIDRSPMLTGYMAHKSGRVQKSDTKYQFYNKSRAQAYGIMSQIDGDGLSYASLEEIDDMPVERLYSRLFPMLAGTQRLGAPEGTIFKPQIRITGVFKGADTLSGLIDSGGYHVLPTVNVYLALELGILDMGYIDQKRKEMPSAEYIRQYLCKNVQAQNHIWEKYIRLAMSIGIQAQLVRAGPLPGQRYKKRGHLAFGYDHTGHGESLSASKSALVVCEQLGNYVFFPYVKTWPAGTDDNVVRRELVELWRYFQPDSGLGDAYGVGMLTSVNDDLFAKGLTEIDRRTIADGESNASAWPEWAFAPIRFEGMVKHSMASALRAAMHNRYAAIPEFDEDSESDGDKDWQVFVRQLGNIKQVANKTSSYPSYKQVDIKIGDDLFDAACAGVWSLNTRGADHIPTIISGRTQTREQLLGMGRAA
ncbi:hypothetical protein [Herminiimonas contaminans]|uniref:Uncharacterized protein n=1 Tax=Herminiimonas contaminans TaxID=1111140 RepID=A0ABS0EXT6_9BURK|nr:hypothetical protein [Herminiimonas contaminans]MBF8179647.1 hypothetical protein [Herminiimonas contaminans]